MEALEKDLCADVHPRTLKRRLALGIGFLVLLCALLVSASSGVVEIAPHDLLPTLLGSGSPEDYRILWHIRLPRIITGALTGVNLALAGCILQGILKTPLADPGIIGVSAGAGLAAMCIMILLPAETKFVPLGAFVGAIIAVALVFALSWENGVHPMRMVLAGVAIAAFFGGAMTALAPRPRLLLLDEPLSALDRALRERLAVDLRRILTDQGTTALYVTHDRDEAEEVADRVGVMEAGRLLRLDAPEALRADPGGEAVARLLGSSGRGRASPRGT